MTYAFSAGLQEAVYSRLQADAALTSVVADHVYDALPSGGLPEIYVLIGPEKVRDASDQSGAGAEHDFVVSIISGSTGFASAKGAAAAVCDALIDATFPLPRGHLVGISFRRAEAARVGSGQIRRINLTFRARVDGV